MFKSKYEPTFSLPSQPDDLEGTCFHEYHLSRIQALLNMRKMIFESKINSNLLVCKPVCWNMFGYLNPMTLETSRMTASSRENEKIYDITTVILKEIPEIEDLRNINNI